MSSNIPQLDVNRRKRSHDGFVDSHCGRPSEPEGEELATKLTGPAKDASEKENDLAAESDPPNHPPRTGLAVLAESGSALLNPAAPGSGAPPAPDGGAHESPSSQKTQAGSPIPTETPPLAPATVLQPDAEPATKRKRMTKEEKASKEQELARRKEEKEADKAARAAEKAAEKAKKEADKAKKEAEKRQKAEEKEKKEREKEEEKARRERSQARLHTFFQAATPKKSTPARADNIHDKSPSGSPKKGASTETSLYRQMFKPFFVKEQVTMAPMTSSCMDEETREAKSSILDEYVAGDRVDLQIGPFGPLKSLQLPCRRRRRRGRAHPSVRKLMADFESSPHRPVDLSTDAQNTYIQRTREALERVPMKYLAFREDVRPPYFGTITSYPAGIEGLRRLARKPLSKDIFPLNYDYDSEAEWQDDEGEDVDALDDEEEDLDNDEDMGDFLDDSEDAAPARPAFSGGIEPESTGIRWAGHGSQGPLPDMYRFSMEFIIDAPDVSSGIDPFSTCYWEPAPSAAAPSGAAQAGRRAPPTSSAMAPPSAPSDAFQALTTPASAPKKPRLLAPEQQQKLREFILSNATLSRVGMVEVFSTLERNCPKTVIRATLDLLAEKSGKTWTLKPDA